MDSQINNWFISPEGDNQTYISNFFSKIIEQLITEKSNASFKELIPDQIEEFSFVSEFEKSHGLEQILNKLSVVYKSSMNASASGYIGQMDSIPNIGAIAGDLITASINNNMLAYEMSPFLTLLEQEVTTILSKWFGFDKRSGGVMTSGGTLANIQALTVARNVKLSLKNGNLSSLNKQPVLFASQHCHSSISKAGMLIGIGIENVIKVETDETGKMSINNLRKCIEKSIQENKIPFAVVSTYGTTNSGSLDPVDKIQLICNEFGLWHHIDAIYGGAMILSENHKHLCPVFESADSLSFNPQKWMFVSKTCSVLIFKNFKSFKDNFKISAPYVSESDKTNLGELGIQGSRHTSVLKLWLSLYLVGKEGYAKIIDQNMDITKSFAEFVIKHPDLELYTMPKLNIFLFRLKNKLEQTQGNHTNILEFQNYLYKKNTYISPIKWEGQLWLKCIFLNPYFDFKKLEVLKEDIENYFLNKRNRD